MCGDFLMMLLLIFPPLLACCVVPSLKLFLMAAAVNNIRVPRCCVGPPDFIPCVDSQLGFYPGVAEEAELQRGESHGAAASH